jgi:hypothetical protein
MLGKNKSKIACLGCAECGVQEYDFFQTTVLRLDRLGLPAQGKAQPSRSAKLFSSVGLDIPVLWLCCTWVTLSC